MLIINLFHFSTVRSGARAVQTKSHEAVAKSNPGQHLIDSNG